MAMSLNSVQLIGNLTRDPELRYTPTGKAVCTIGLATNRSWTTEAGEKKEETEFHRIVVWGKLAELCSQLLSKGTKAYFHGRLTTRSWTAQDGTQKTSTEIIADDMIVLSPKKSGSTDVAGNANQHTKQAKPTGSVKSKEGKSEEANTVPETPAEEPVSPDDIPF